MKILRILVLALPLLLTGCSATVVMPAACGLEPVMVSALPCITAGDVDWIVDDSDKPNYTFISFGRTPATAVTIDSTKSSGANVLEDLGQAVQFTKQSKKCLD